MAENSATKLSKDFKAKRPQLKITRGKPRHGESQGIKIIHGKPRHAESQGIKIIQGKPRHGESQGIKRDHKENLNAEPYY
jgi:hypothetical protein